MSPEQLRRMALRTGAQVEIGGRTTNAARQRLTVVPARPQADAAAPSVPADPLGVIAEIMAANARISAQQAETVGLLIGRLAEALPSPAAAPAAAAAAAPPARRFMPILFTVARGRDGAALSLEPIYGEVGDDAELAELVPEHDARGLLSRITPKYTTGEPA